MKTRVWPIINSGHFYKKQKGLKCKLHILLNIHLISVVEFHFQSSVDVSAMGHPHKTSLVSRFLSPCVSSVILSSFFFRCSTSLFISISCSFNALNLWSFSEVWKNHVLYYSSAQGAVCQYVEFLEIFMAVEYKGNAQKQDIIYILFSDFGCIILRDTLYTVILSMFRDTNKLLDMLPGLLGIVLLIKSCNNKVISTKTT